MPRPRLLTEEEIRRASIDLRDADVPATQTNIAEHAAVSGETPTLQGAVREKLLSGKGGPVSGIAKRKEAEMEEERRRKLREGPPAALRRALGR